MKNKPNWNSIYINKISINRENSKKFLMNLKLKIKKELMKLKIKNSFVKNNMNWI